MRIFISVLSIAVLTFFLVFFGTNDSNNEYLRIHIRANSNQTVDQNIKYQIKDAVVDAMIPFLAECETKEKSYQIIENNLQYIENVANNVLILNNYNYTCNAKMSYENFPTRTYGNLTLESGFYDALILELGEAVGDNWWCVVYPPLCFVNGSTNVSIFKSRIIEIIKSFGIVF
ncbi:MAG: stage II sporulation protein R [Clostridia bacterium]|nr:stage II sporulation protein R [Clostridia bacterium]